MPERIEQIKNWLENDLKLSIQFFEPASSDASFRRYFRVKFNKLSNQQLLKDNTYIIMDAPPENEDCQPFINIANLLSSLNIHVPEIYYQNIQKGFLLLSDLGNDLYLNHLNDSNADLLYQQAFEVLYRLQSCSFLDESLLAEYSEQKLREEMSLFENWFIKVHLQYQLNTSEEGVLHQFIEQLIEDINNQPKVIVHRDFHSRNLMLCETNSPGVIDFQDAVIGPCSYDLVSLIRDSYIVWPETRVDKWIQKYAQKSFQGGFLNEKQLKLFPFWVDTMGMQRQLKVVGIFARLYHRDAKDNYLKDIPATYQYLLNTVKKYPQYKDLELLLTKLRHLDRDSQ